MVLQTACNAKNVASTNEEKLGVLILEFGGVMLSQNLVDHGNYGVPHGSMGFHIGPEYQYTKYTHCREDY
jgi:hypothetical protein